jgi:hypothetical protein
MRKVVVFTIVCVKRMYKIYLKRKHIQVQRWLSFRMLRRVLWKKLTVSEVLTASIIRAMTRSISTRLHRSASQEAAIFTLIAVSISDGADFTASARFTVFVWQVIACSTIWNSKTSLLCRVAAHVDGVRPCLWTAATTGPVVHPPDYIWVWKTTVEWQRRGEPEELREKSVPLPLCPPHIPHGLSWAWTRASADCVGLHML